MNQVIFMVVGLSLFGYGVVGWITDHVVEKTVTEKSTETIWRDKETGEELAWLQSGIQTVDKRYQIVLRKKP